VARVLEKGGRGGVSILAGSRAKRSRRGVLYWRVKRRRAVENQKTKAMRKQVEWNASLLLSWVSIRSRLRIGKCVVVKLDDADRGS